MRQPADLYGGFTLLEVMVVVVIIGLLAGIVTPSVMKQLGKAQVGRAEADIRNISAGLDLFYTTHYRYPTTDEGLEILLGGPEIDGRLVDEYVKSLPVDPWERPYHYENPGHHGDDYDVFTLGADGREGGDEADADIGSWGIR